MIKKPFLILICFLFSLLLYACKKDARCTCTYTVIDYSTNDTTIDIYTKKILERKSAQKKACESANFAGTNLDKNYHYETRCRLD